MPFAVLHVFPFHGFLWVYRFIPTSQKHAGSWIGVSKLPLCVNVCAHMLPCDVTSMYLKLVSLMFCQKAGLSNYQLFV